jgi:hypothetical protein
MGFPYMLFHMTIVMPIGITNWREQHIPFGIKEKDRLGHIYCIGKTGVGKTTLLLTMAIADIRHGRGVGIIDPHGDVSAELLDYIPKHRIQDVVYCNPGDELFPIAFNPLYNIQEPERYLAGAAIVTALKMLFTDSWGPRLEHILRFTILSLLHYPKASLLDIQPLLTDYEFRKTVLSYVTDNTLLRFWFNEFQPLSPQLKNEYISPIINKVGLFTAHPLIRNIIGQQRSSFDILDIMDSQKIFIANLSKGVLGEAGTQFLGSLLISQFQIASLRRIHQPPERRTPFFLFIDEIQSFITLSFADILSESRKFGLALFMSHQFFDQIKEEIRKAILGNIGTLIAFRVGASDAKILETEFYPTFSQTDLLTLPKYHVYLKLLIDGATSQPFSATTNQAPTKGISFAAAIIARSRKKYATRKDVAEAGLWKKYSRETHLQPSLL